MELVAHMGIKVKATVMAMCLRKCNRQPTRLMRLLMDNLFTEEEMSVKGKGARPALDETTMEAILCKLQISVGNFSHFPLMFRSIRPQIQS